MKMRGSMLCLLIGSWALCARGQECKPAIFEQEYKAANSLIHGNYLKALAAAEDLVSRYQGTNSHCEGRALQLLGRVIWANGEYDESVALLRKARVLVVRDNDQFASAEIDNVIGDNYYYQAYYDSAIKYYKSAIAIYEREKHQTELMNSLHKLAVMYHRKGDISSALHFLYKSEELKTVSPGKTHDLADFGGSSSFFYDTLYYRTKIIDELGQLNIFRQNKNQRGEYNTLLNLGIAHAQLGEHLQAARYMAKGSRIMSAIGYYPLWHSAGREYGKAGLKDSCFYFHYLAKAEFPTTTQIKRVSTLELLGDSHALFGNLDSAAWYLEKSQVLNREMNNRITIPGVNGRLARVYFRMGNYARAEELLIEGVKQARGTSRQFLLNLFEFGRMFYMETGNPTRALHFADQARALSDSINRIDGALALVYYQAHFESARKERDLKQAQSIVRNRTVILTSVAAFSVLAVAWGATLFIQRRRIARQNLLLQESNAEQRALTQEVHHRVKNNLQYIVSLLNLQSQMAKTPELTIQLEEIKNRIMTMGVIHQRLYKVQGLQRVEVSLFVNELVANLLSALPPLTPMTSRIDVDPLQVDVDVAISIGLLINELVTNAVKHAFVNHPSPELTLSLKQNHEGMVLRVKDNGPGFRFPGNRTGFGLKLIQLLMQKLHGTLSQPDLNTVEIRMARGMGA